MSLDTALRDAQRTIPECVAAGVVDMNTGVLLSVKTVESHPQEVLNVVAAATGEIFQGENVTAIERTFKRIRGISGDDHHYFQELVVFSDNLLHIFQRCKRHVNVVMVSVCRKQANLGMALVRARSTLDAVDQAV